MRKIFENKDFIILQKGTRSSYILYNKHKSFNEGHTHISNYGGVRWLMKLYSKRIVPQKMKSMYLIESLIRISDDEQYTISLLNNYFSFLTLLLSINYTNNMVYFFYELKEELNSTFKIHKKKVIHKVSPLFLLFKRDPDDSL